MQTKIIEALRKEQSLEGLGEAQIQKIAVNLARSIENGESVTNAQAISPEVHLAIQKEESISFKMGIEQKK